MSYLSQYPFIGALIFTLIVVAPIVKAVIIKMKEDRTKLKQKTEKNNS